MSNLLRWCSETNHASGALKRRHVPRPPATRPAYSSGSDVARVEIAESA